MEAKLSEVKREKYLIKRQNQELEEMQANNLKTVNLANQIITDDKTKDTMLRKMFEEACFYADKLWNGYDREPFLRYGLKSYVAGTPASCWDIFIKEDDRRLIDFILAKNGYKGIIARVTKCRCRACRNNRPCTDANTNTNPRYAKTN